MARVITKLGKVYADWEEYIITAVGGQINQNNLIAGVAFKVKRSGEKQIVIGVNTNIRKRFDGKNWVYELLTTSKINEKCKELGLSPDQVIRIIEDEFCFHFFNLKAKK